MASVPARILRWLLYLVAGVVIVLALGVGLLRLLLPLVPQYHEDIRAWASTATGYDIRFARISASWPLGGGPQLIFDDVTLTRPGEAAPVIAAREFSVGVSLLQLVIDRRLTLGHLLVRGSSMGLVLKADGSLLVQGRRLEELLPRPSGRPLPEVRVDLEDIAVSYAEERRNIGPLPLAIEQLSIDLNGEELTADGEVALPEAYGQKLRFDLSTPLPLPEPLAVPANWQLRVSGTDVDLVRLLSLRLEATSPLRAARGDVGVEIVVRDARLQRLGGDGSLAGVELGMGAESVLFERVSGSGAWSRTDVGWDLALDRLRTRRDGRDSPQNDVALHYEAPREGRAARWRARAAFFRLENVFPLVRAALTDTEYAARLPRELAGDIRDLEGEIAPGTGDAQPDYTLRLGFARLRVADAAGALAASGLTGSITADTDGGRLQLDSREVSVGLSDWFRNALEAEAVQGLLVWRAGRDGVRLVSDNVSVKAPAIDIRSRFSMQFPADGGSPVIDLKASASATEARQVLRYLPLRRFPPKVVDWLERAIVAGRVPQGTVEFRGPVREFPFDHGEGTFRVALDLQDGTLDYANGWPRVEALAAAIVFDGVGMSSTSNRGRLGKLDVSNYDVRIPDLRKGILALSGRQRAPLDGVLDFLRATPLTTAIGPVLGRVTASGPVDAALRLQLPIGEIEKYDLNVLFDARGCALSLQSLPVDLKNLRGRVRLQNTKLSGEGLRAVMLGEPVQASLRPGPDGSGISHVAQLSGSSPVARVMSTFRLPGREYLDGRVGWDATVSLPERRKDDAVPLTVAIRSDLRGVASTLPQPLGKPAEAAWPALVELAFPKDDVIEVTGGMQPPFAWALRLASTSDGWQVERGELHAGPGEAHLPSRRGVIVNGRVEELRINDWLSLGGSGGEGGRSARDIYREVELQADRLVLAGQRFPAAGIRAVRGPDAWSVNVTGPNAEGQVTVPFDTATRPLLLDMRRLWLLDPDPAEAGTRTDPRSLIAARVQADDAAIGGWRVGRLELSLERAPDGLVARRVSTRARTFQIDGEGSWRVERDNVDRQYTRMQATLQGTDVKDALEQLGFDPAITGKSVKATANLVWPDGPSGNFLARASGQIGLEMKSGQIMNLEPGGGRLLGLLSVTALPRRLSLDFRDVFNEGLGYDTIKGDFRLGGSGIGYTCNLGLSGPVADIAIVGRTGFASREYDQVAVVRPQVSNVLTVGGAVLGGPVGGVTMALLSQLFRKPLSTLGESYYRITGGWDKPDVARVERNQLQVAAFKDCEKEVVAVLEAGEPADRR